jgi:hypothetical protein
MDKRSARVSENENGYARGRGKGESMLQTPQSALLRDGKRLDGEERIF